MTPLYTQTFGYDLTLHDAKVTAVDTRRSDGELVGTAIFRLYDRAVGDDSERAFEYVVAFHGVSGGFTALERGMDINDSTLTQEGETFRLELMAAPKWEEISFSFHRLTEKSLEPTT